MQVIDNKVQLSNVAVNKNIRDLWVVYAHIYVKGKKLSTSGFCSAPADESSRSKRHVVLQT